MCFHGCKLFAFRVDPFSEGKQNNFDEVASSNMYPFPLQIHLATLQAGFSMLYYELNMRKCMIKGVPFILHITQLRHT